MQAIVIERTGAPEVLELRDAPVPEPKAGEALIKLEASGVNFIDVYFRNGTYKAPHFPWILGQEAAGVVAAVGAGVSDVKTGDRVAYAGTPGAYAEYAAVPAATLAHVPENVSLRDAAALMLQGMTAHYLVNSLYELRRGETALVHAGAGGVGLLLTQLAKVKGAIVIATVSSEEKAALSRQAGADHTIDYTREDFSARARELTGGKGVDVVYDSVGKTTWEGSLEALRPRGMFALFGGSSGPVPPIDPMILNAKGSLFITRPTLGNSTATPDERAGRARELFAAVADGTLRLRLEHLYPLAAAAQAHRDLEARKTTGKLLLLP